GQHRQVLEAARGVEFCALVAVLGDRDDVARLAGFDEVRDRGEDQPVVLAVEVLGDHEVRHLVPGGAVDHEPTEQRLLGFGGVRGHAQATFGALDAAGVVQCSNHVTVSPRRAVRRPLARSARPGGAHSSGTTFRLTSPSTSVCRCTPMTKSPVSWIGPSGMRISLRATSTPTFSKASAMSTGPTEPNSLPSGPTFART